MAVLTRPRQFAPERFPNLALLVRKRSLAETGDEVDQGRVAGRPHLAGAGPCVVANSSPPSG